ncbi:uncharacterized protein FIESC28_02305 [Fusarium coffeatum]|uniref:F-box domain-containing protein n=1 Tax=Fusarium coffeatum TaxID=231269 RepID=A0A366S6C8_9HYPO|nr:uncharacterized protein FIESC28_02305 [Fusarium coffeatum]RBR24887.1 hypothetical protein FIESC28_02305 [Fusarium coffeatum]
MSDAKHPRALSLESLPPEILLSVITSLPSLDPLWNLLQASPQAWRFFEDGLKSLLITEGILSGPQSIIPSKVRELIRAVILPLHAYNPSPHYTHDYKDTEEWIPAWDREFVGTPVSVTDMGQPTWVEEMRVVRVMWIIQLVRDMQLLATNRPGIGWPKDDISLLLGMGPVDLILDRDSPLPDTEPIKSAMDYLATLTTPRKDVFYRLPPAPAPSVNNRWITAPPNHNEVFMQVRGYRLNGKFHWLGQGLRVPEGATPVELPTFTEEKKWEQTAKAFDFRPYGVNFWQRLRDHLRSASGVNDTQYTFDEFYFFVWESILLPEEVDGIKARAREARRDQEARFPRPV